MVANNDIKQVCYSYVRLHGVQLRYQLSYLEIKITYGDFFPSYSFIRMKIQIL
jgi:hypothetical protein